MSPTSAIAAASDVGDPAATRTVYVTVVLLAALGVVLVGLTIFVFRRTRPEPELLSPLETMDTRSWRKLDPAAQRRLLDEARPPGASPLRREASEPALDASFATVAPVASFDDLSENSSDTDDRHEPIEDPDADDVDDLDPDDAEQADTERDDADPDRRQQPVEQSPGQVDDTEESERIAVPDDDPDPDDDSPDRLLDDTDLDVDVPEGTAPGGEELRDIGETDGAVAPRSIDPLLTPDDRSSDASN